MEEGAGKWGQGTPPFINLLCPTNSMYFLSINFNDHFQPLIKDEERTRGLGVDFAVANELESNENAKRWTRTSSPSPLPSDPSSQSMGTVLHLQKNTGPALPLRGPSMCFQPQIL